MKSTTNQLKRFVTRGVMPTLLVTSMLSLNPASSARAGSDQAANPGVIPPWGRHLEQLYGELGAEFWKTGFSIPVVDSDHPFFSGGAFGDSKGLMFLSGVGAGTPSVDVTIPAGTFLFFPVVNAECSVVEPDPFHGDNEAEMRECANGHIDNTSGLFAEIDDVTVENLDDYRVDSPLFEFGPLPADNIYGLPESTTSYSVDAGVYLLLAPLSVGQHTIHFGGTFDEFGYTIDTTYNITVVAGQPL